MRPPFCIFKLQSDRSEHFVEAVQAFDNAKARVQALAELWPGEYVIINEATGERVCYRRRRRGVTVIAHTDSKGKLDTRSRTAAAQKRSLV